MAPDLHTLTGAYAADALADDDERREFELHLARCPDCREEVRTLRETVAVLAAALAVAPPPGLRARVLAEVAGTRQWPPPRTRTVAAGAPTRRWPAAVAAAVLLVGLGTGGTGFYRAHQAQQELTEARAQAARVASVLAAPDARRTAGQVTGGGQVSLVVADGRAVLLTDGVAGLPDGRTYQLWLLRGDRVSPAGFGPAGTAAAGSWSRLVDGVRPGDKVAVSVEPDGGSAQPTTTPVTVLQA
jgi:anti-sigma-K factor RskA